jgi:uncharacterized protein involved in outer membrane biogenesis
LAGGSWFRLLLFLAIFFAGLALAWMILLPPVLTRFVRGRTGFAMEIQTLYINPFTGRLALRGLAVTNPPAFPNPAFAEVREVRVDWRVSSLFSQRLVIDDAVIDVAGVTLVKDSHGAINAWLFQERLAGASAARPQAGTPVEAKSRPQEFLIKRLQLRCDRLVIADYSRGQPTVRELALNFNHTYENVTSATQLAAPFGDLLAPVAAAVGGLVPEAGAALRAAGDKVKETGRKTGEAVKEFLDSLEKSRKK